MDKSPQTIIAAKNSNSDRNFQNLHLDPISRDKISEKLPLLNLWVKKLELKSGRDLENSDGQ